MKRIILWSMFLWVMTMSAAADKGSSRIDYIRQAYEGRLAAIANRPYEDIPTNQTTIEDYRMLPATGLYHNKVTFYYDDDMNEDGYSEQLFYVTEDKVYCSGMYKFHFEFLYDRETAEPLFAFITTQTGDGELSTWRFYLDSEGKVIRQLISQAPENDLAPLITDTPEAYLSGAFAYYRNLFNQLPKPEV